MNGPKEGTNKQDIGSYGDSSIQIKWVWTRTNQKPSEYQEYRKQYNRKWKLEQVMKQETTTTKQDWNEKQ